ncbi:MAG: hypothetical protein EAZ60_21825 [Oscillatoriales cyanobacterium]|nr:MAG: hypothetical protein EAZ83_09440 [Oscillatoriales cyanobacterium]TAE94731.1 MAG: hypothetical protein EAZ79_21725 [Oscillatoriales cyanobacterium]TAF20709.1 MAG: hypothetical protein EAZ73_11235 [Oscillatoriales cyanobacterium]TAF36872.1 MAG: hypothetical protein EAZ69_09210 [Oscillatoriales cyanobacterium]TAF52995.1 MAG: hypothetical protein EAZ60_21825 [Oscillatoriales cyanobacterium]
MDAVPKIIKHTHFAKSGKRETIVLFGIIIRPLQKSQSKAGILSAPQELLESLLTKGLENQPRSINSPDKCVKATQGKRLMT